jgi:hypothetical protein
MVREIRVARVARVAREEAREARVVVGEDGVRSGWCGRFGGGTGTEPRMDHVTFSMLKPKGRLR